MCDLGRCRVLLADRAENLGAGSGGGATTAYAMIERTKKESCALSQVMHLLGCIHDSPPGLPAFALTDQTPLHMNMHHRHLFTR